MTNHYETLDVPRDAPADIIARAWKRAASAFHPDRHPEDKRDEMSEKFRAAREAYTVLMDREQRARYDASLSGVARTGVIVTVTREQVDQALSVPLVDGDVCVLCDGERVVRVGGRGFWQTKNCPRCNGG